MAAAVPSVELREEAFDGEGTQRLLASFIAEISELYPGWLPSRGPSAVAADFTPPAGRFVVAYQAGRPVACAGLKRFDARTGEIKRVYVAPEARRRGVARQLLDYLEGVARAAGYEVARLDTGAHQPNAVRLFTAAGYREIADYNANPFARHWFEKRL